MNDKATQKADSKSNLCLILSIVSLFTAVGQFFLISFIMYLSAHGLEGIFLNIFFTFAWLGCPAISFFSAVFAFVSFINSKGGELIIRRRIGLVLAVISLPLNVIVFLFDTVMCLLS